MSTKTTHLRGIGRTTTSSTEIRVGGVNQTTPLRGRYLHRHHHGKSPSSGRTIRGTNRIGKQIRGDSEENDNVFDLNRGGGVNQTTPLRWEIDSGTLREITQQWVMADEGDENLQQGH